MDYGHWGTNAVVVATTIVLVFASVGVHYEGLNYLARRLSKREGPRRPRVMYAVLGSLALHIIEIWLWGLGLWALTFLPEGGFVVGVDGRSLLDSIYLSATTYSTVGFGDVAPVGPIRFPIGTEALLGLLLITWSASFTYLEMERNWRER